MAAGADGGQDREDKTSLDFRRNAPMKKQLLAVLASMALLFAGPTVSAQQGPSPASYLAGMRVAASYAYGYNSVNGANIVQGFTGTGTQSMTACPAVRALGDGRIIPLFNVNAPIGVDIGTAIAETVTPTSVSLIAPPQGQQGDQQCAVITASFSNAHGQSQFQNQLRSGSFGLQEAINDAAAGANGGVVVVDGSWGGTNATLTAAVPFADVTIADNRFGPTQYWNPIGAAAAIGTPAVLTNATAGFGVNGANFTGGAYTGSNTYITCIAYVDIMGQEGPCSPTFTVATSGSATTDQIGYTAPAASTGAVGYTIYITLNGGAYTSAYKVPLVSQPTVVGAYPAANGVCTLTTVEVITPACRLTNATYGQTGVGAVVSALTLNTSPIEPQASIVSTTAIFVPNPGGRSSYVYSPGSRIGVPGLPSASLVFPISGSAASTVPTVLGTINIPPGFMNFVGRTIEICGRSGITTGSTTTILTISFQWDSMGQNTAGAGVTIGALAVTPATAFATTEMDNFCEDFQTTVAAATATGGTIQRVGGFLATSGVSAAAAGQAAGGDATTAATGSLNLAADARINVVYTHTTGTFAPTLQGLTVKVLN
jgi:hypothetical protein